MKPSTNMKMKSISYRSLTLAPLAALMLMQFTDATQAQSPWTTKASLPAGGATMAAASINGIVYVAGGNNGSPMANLQAYNTTNNTWSAKAALPGGRYQNDGMGVISNKLYFPGGWTTSPPLPNNNLWVYDPVANTWDTTRASMPTLSAQGACGVINNKLYVTTAANGYSGYASELDVYDPGSNTWTTLSSSPRPHANPGYGVIGNKLYLAGGYDGANTTNILDVYDPVSNTWTTQAPMPTSRYAVGSAVVNGKLYVFGGVNPAGTIYLNTVEVYDPASNSWMTESNMPTARASCAAASANGVAYVTGGGNSGSGSLTTVEALTPTIASINVFAGIWVSGLIGGTYEIDYRNSLNSGTWTPLTTTLVLSSNPTLYIDTNSPNYTQRFYRTTFLH
jgi:N-acetylneuraminic acid mutarotase